MVIFPPAVMVVPFLVHENPEAFCVVAVKVAVVP
jgi:hypothetical protein